MDPLTLIGLGYSLLTVASILALHAGKVVVPRVGEWATPPRVLVYRHGPVTVEEVRKALKVLQGLGHAFGEVVEVSSVAVTPGAIVIGPMSQEQAKANAIAAATWTTAFTDDEVTGFDTLEAPPLQTTAKHILGPILNGLIQHAYVGLDALMLEGRDPVQVLAHELAHAIGFLHEETALFGRKKVEVEPEPVQETTGATTSTSKKKGKARFGVIGRKTGHLMNPIYEKGGMNLKGMEVEALDSERQVIKRRKVSKR